jgi:transposase
MKLRRSRLSDQQSERLLEHFVAGTSARSAAALIGVNRNTARLFYHRLRELIAERLPRSSPLELDVVATGGRRTAATRWSSETPVFGLSVHHGKVIAVPVRAERSETLPSAAGANARLDAIVYADLRTHRAVLDVSSLRPRRVGKSGRPLRGRPRIDRVENFWSQTKRHLSRYNGIPREHLHLFLKECEWRFNYGPPAQLHKMLKAWIKAI